MVDSKEKSKSFPIFDLKWIPLSHQRNKSGSAKFLKYKIDKILREISDLSKNATGFIHACDYDQEGELIGYNILQFACQKKYDVSRRAKFSTLTDEEITQSFENLLPPNHHLKDAGITRHTIDFIYGINFSRLLTNSVKKYYSDQSLGKKFVQLSIGRVQGPTLAFVVERENEILKHISVPYWNVIADFIKDEGNEGGGGGEVEGKKLRIAHTDKEAGYDQKKSSIIHTMYFPQKIETKDNAIRVVDECRNQVGTITFAKTFKTPVKPPHPFNLGDLQREAFRIFRFTPSYTLSLAEKLYLAALISYPRTSSQKLPSTINYKKIINNISNFDNTSGNGKYDDKISDPQRKLTLHEICDKLLSTSTTTTTTTSLIPNEGKEIDPAHPAIYPTGERPKKILEQSESKLYDLIIRRFLSTFGPEAVVSQTSINITVKGNYIFKADEKKILTKGWIEFYFPYFDYSSFANNNSNLSILKINDKLKNVEIEILEKSTQPPPRYNQSTLLQKMEKERIGTKATRSEIINTLFKRNYVYDFSGYDREAESGNLQPRSLNSIKNDSESALGSKSNNTMAYRRTGIRPTQLGISLINSMQKYVPTIISTGLTRTMEERLASIESGENRSDFVISQAQTTVKKGIESFVKKQTEIGKDISSSLKSDTQTTSIESAKKSRITIIGRCPVCLKGDLIIKKSAKTKKRFAGCSNYSREKCTATASLPLRGTLRGTQIVCDRCKWPIILATGINAGKKYEWRLCINRECPLKKEKIKK